MNEETDICVTCNKEKPVSEFQIDKNRTKGRRNDCKLCRKTYLKEYSKKNKESLTIKRKIWMEGIKSKKREERERNKKIYDINNIEEYKGRTVNLSKEQVEMVINLYKNDHGYEKIEKLTGAKEDTIIRILKRYNIVHRSIGRIRRYNYDECFLDKIDTQEKAYFLGFFCADGNVSDGCRNIRINLQERDVDILLKFKEMFKYEGPLYYVKKKSVRQGENIQNQYQFQISCKKIALRLTELGFPERKTFKTKLPDYITDELMPHFLRGLNDGDGCISSSKANKKGRMRWSVQYCGTYQLMNEIKEYLVGMHISSSLSKSGNIYKLTITNIGSLNKFVDYIYKDTKIHLNRKYNKYLDYKEYYKNYYEK